MKANDKPEWMLDWETAPKGLQDLQLICVIAAMVECDKITRVRTNYITRENARTRIEDTWEMKLWANSALKYDNYQACNEQSDGLFIDSVGKIPGVREFGRGEWCFMTAGGDFSIIITATLEFPVSLEVIIENGISSEDAKLTREALPFSHDNCLEHQ